MKPHEKIIKQTAKKVLAPEGLFQVGQSRTWLEDNGYYLTMIEFQSSSYGRGAYLNAGISFLWETTESLNQMLSFDYTLSPHTARVQENEQYNGRPYPGPAGLTYASYDGDDAKFGRQIEQFAGRALNCVMEFRKFRELSFAKQAFIKRVEETEVKRVFWEMYHLAMLCFFKGDFEDGRTYLQKYMEILKDSFWNGDCYIEWHEEFYHYCEAVLLPQCSTESAARIMVQDMISRQRGFFGNKPSFKGWRRNQENESAF